MKNGMYANFSDEELIRESILQGERVRNATNEEELEDEEHRLFVIEAMLDYRIALAKRMSERADREREDFEVSDTAPL